MHLQEVSRESKIAMLRRLKLGPLSDSFPSFGNPLSLRGMQRGLVEQPQKRTAWVNQRICATPQNGEAQCTQSFCFFFFFSSWKHCQLQEAPPRETQKFWEYTFRCHSSCTIQLIHMDHLPSSGDGSRNMNSSQLQETIGSDIPQMIFKVSSSSPALPRRWRVNIHRSGAFCSESRSIASIYLFIWCMGVAHLFGGQARCWAHGLC